MFWYFLLSLAKQDGEVLQAANAIDDDEMDETWKAMQQQAGIKGQACFENWFWHLQSQDHFISLLRGKTIFEASCKQEASRI